MAEPVPPADAPDPNDAATRPLPADGAPTEAFVPDATPTAPFAPDVPFVTAAESYAPAAGTTTRATGRTAPSWLPWAIIGAVGLALALLAVLILPQLANNDVDVITTPSPTPTVAVTPSAPPAEEDVEEEPAEEPTPVEPAPPAPEPTTPPIPEPTETSVPEPTPTP